LTLQAFQQFVYSQHFINPVAYVMIWFADATFHWLKHNLTVFFQYQLLDISWHIDYDWGLLRLPDGVQCIWLTVDVTG
jgi:hypothetical protein